MSNIRSLLFVPAEKRKLAKIGQTNADAYIIDLEDSIAIEDKDDALKRTVEYLSSYKGNNLYVRINRTRYKTELDALKKYPIGFVLPKFESEYDYVEAEDILSSHETIVIIETASALMNANVIASTSWVSALAFGAEDFTVATNYSNDTNSLSVPKSLLALAAKANDKMVFDTPCFQIKNKRRLDEELQQAVKLGYDGKLAIHPSHIECINRAFKLVDSEYVRKIIDIYEKSGNAVCEIDGSVYEKIHIDKLRERLNMDY